MTEEQKELEFLRYFYQNAGYAMGPADGDCYDAIRDAFEKQTGYLPEGYKREER